MWTSKFDILEGEKNQNNISVPLLCILSSVSGCPQAKGHKMIGLEANPDPETCPQTEQITLKMYILRCQHSNISRFHQSSGILFLSRSPEVSEHSPCGSCGLRAVAAVGSRQQLLSPLGRVWGAPSSFSPSPSSLTFTADPPSPFMSPPWARRDLIVFFVCFFYCNFNLILFF